MKRLPILILFICIGFSANAQTDEELKAEELKKELAPKKDSIAKLQAKVNALQAKIDALPGWRKGAFGTIGGSISGFNNWYSKTAPNSSAGNIGITLNGFANLIQEKFFWRNSVNINLGWVKSDNRDDPDDSGKFETATDVFNLTSLYGIKFNKKWSFSALGEYRTTLLDNFNNPGYLDLGIGITWTPIGQLVVVIHPANYNIVFSTGENTYTSSSGAKIIADYNAKYGKLSVKSNLSVFQSYRSADFSNWTWTNSLGYTLWKGIGLGFELGLRNNKQEALNFARIDDPDATFSTIENRIQSYWLFGVSYSF